jgi:hypothetical protein
MGFAEGAQQRCWHPERLCGLDRHGVMTAIGSNNTNKRRGKQKIQLEEAASPACYVISRRLLSN